MDYVTLSELRSESAKVWDKVAAGEEIVLTRNGKPFAIILPTQPSDVEGNLQTLRAADFSRVPTQQSTRGDPWPEQDDVERNQCRDRDGAQGNSRAESRWSLTPMPGCP